MKTLKSDIFKADFFKPFFFKQPRNPFYDGSSYLKLNRQCGILMSNVYSRSDDKMNFIAFHYESYNFIGRPLAKSYTVIVRFEYFIYLLQCKDSFSYKVDTIYEAFRW